MNLKQLISGLKLGSEQTVYISEDAGTFAINDFGMGVKLDLEDYSDCDHDRQAAYSYVKECVEE